MDSALWAALIGAAVTVIVWMLSARDAAQRTLAAEDRQQARAGREALEAQADELVAAVLAVQVAGAAHDHLYGSWKARVPAALSTVGALAAAYLRNQNREPTAAALVSGHGEAAASLAQWNRDSALSAAGLTVPLTRLGVAVPPLLRRTEPGIAEAAGKLLEAATKHYTDTARIDRALEAFMEAVRPALAPPAPPRRWWQRRATPGSTR
ncbi:MULTISPECIES: hypothetical protein [unclassified Streptomyces]|uniref:hypothetical protein n=1 Tax=unclassified Streptomyces TaxID=2593676 RepID=UPI000A537A23|nr:hypothetical protein [Streptomyces sp. Root1310]